jgi:hypothetical protein
MLGTQSSRTQTPAGRAARTTSLSSLSDTSCSLPPSQLETPRTRVIRGSASHPAAAFAVVEVDDALIAEDDGSDGRVVAPAL